MKPASKEKNSTVNINKIGAIKCLFSKLLLITRYIKININTYTKEANLNVNLICDILLNNK